MGKVVGWRWWCGSNHGNAVAMFFRLSLVASLLSVMAMLPSGCASGGAATKGSTDETGLRKVGDSVGSSAADGGPASGALAPGSAGAAARTTASQASVDGGATLSGSLDPAVIRGQIRRQQARFRACYAQGLRSNANLRGKVLARLVIAADGRVDQAADAGSDLADPATIDCVLSVYKSIVFPPPQGGAMSIVYPLLLDAEGASADAGALAVPTPARLAELVRTLGTTNADPLQSGVLDELRAVPVAAARALVQELKVLSPDAPWLAVQHVVWCVRALRVMTAQDFRYPTKLPLSTAQREIFEGPGSELAFFRVRLASGKLALAPRDVQQQVVAAWQEWLHEHGDGFAVPERGVEFIDWYF